MSSTQPATPLIALVEDDPESAVLLQEYLGLRGMDVTLFDTAEDFLASAADGFQGVILDMRLPGMSGDECGEALRRCGYHGPLIGITGNIEDWDEDSLRAVGFNAVLSKPFDPKELVACLQRELARGP